MTHAMEIQKTNRQEVDAPSIAPAPANLTPMQMAYQLISGGADFASVKEMLELGKELDAHRARRAFDAAVAKAKAEIPVIAKNAKGHNNKRYADFAAYAAALKPILAAHGLSYRFRTEQESAIKVTCILSHEDGHSEENSLTGPADSSGSKNAIQAIGSTLSYLQRYTLIQALGLAASEDDDGQSQGKTPEQITTISEDQQIAIRDAVEAAGLDMRRFLRQGNLERLEDMTVAVFPDAMAMLKRKLQERGNG